MAILGPGCKYLGLGLLSTTAQLLLLPVGLACDKGRGLSSSASLAMLH